MNKTYAQYIHAGNGNRLISSHDFVLNLPPTKLYIIHNSVPVGDADKNYLP